MDAIYQFAKNFANIKYEDLPAGVIEVRSRRYWMCWGWHSQVFPRRPA